MHFGWGACEGCLPLPPLFQHPQPFALCWFLQQLLSTGSCGCLCQHPWYEAAWTDLKGGGPGALERPLAQCLLLQSADSNTQPEGGHGPSVGQQCVTSVPPPTPLYHYILLFLKWSNRLKNAFLITSEMWQDVTCCDRLCYSCEESTGSASPLCHSAGLFQTLAYFLDRNQQHSTSTTYQDSRGISQSVLAWQWDFGSWLVSS